MKDLLLIILVNTNCHIQ